MADKLEPRTIPAALVQSPLVKGKLRAERDDGRPTEDDIAKARLGEQGIPDKPPKPPIADEDEASDTERNRSGHTA